MRRLPAASVRRHGLFHVLKLLVHEGRGLRRVLETVRIGVLLLEEFLVLGRCVDLRQRIRKLLYDVRWCSGPYDDRAKLRQRHLVTEFKRRRHVLKSRQAFSTKQQDGAHLFAIKKLRNVSRLLVKRIGMTAEDRHITLAGLGERHLDDLDAAAIKHGE